MKCISIKNDKNIRDDLLNFIFTNIENLEN